MIYMGFDGFRRVRKQPICEALNLLDLIVFFILDMKFFAGSRELDLDFKINFALSLGLYFAQKHTF